MIPLVQATNNAVLIGTANATGHQHMPPKFDGTKN
jgi:hypothetical protein